MNNNNHIVECLNCGFSFSPHDKYCPKCGQKTVLPGLSLISVIKEYIDIVFNFEYRVWITFFHLFIPGKLSTQYFEGKRQKYLSPLRIFLIFGLIHFAFFGHLINTKFDNQLSFFENYLEENAFLERFIIKIDSLPLHIFKKEGLDTSEAIKLKKDIIQNLNFKKTPSDSIFSNLSGEDPFTISVGMKDSLSADTISGIFQILVFENIQGKWRFKSMPLSFYEVYNADYETIIKKANIRTDFGKWQVKQEMKLQKEIKNFTFFVTSQLIWMVIFSILLISLVQRIIYFRLPFFYAHHLIHNLHFHAFSFFTISLFIIGQHYIFIQKNLGFFIFLIIIYQILAIRRIFKQSWFKTIIKSLFIDLTYFIISTSILLLTIIISVLRF